MADGQRVVVADGETDRLAQLLLSRVVADATRNPTRHELVERIEQFIADYNAGSVNSDEYPKRLIEMSPTLTNEEERAVREGMTEEELAIFDLLTQRDPVLTVEERQRVKASAKQLLAHLHEKLVRDWRRKVDVMSDVNSTIPLRAQRGSLGPLHRRRHFHSKVQLVCDHVLSAYGDDGESAHGARADLTVSHPVVAEYAGEIDVNEIAEDVFKRILSDPGFATRVAEQLRAAPLPTGNPA